MRIWNLEYLEEAQCWVQGGFVVNSTTIIVSQRSLAIAKGVAFYGDANATAKARNSVDITIKFPA